MATLSRISNPKGITLSKRKLNRRQVWRIEKIQAERTKRSDKRENNAQDQLEGSDLGPEQPGLVIAHYGAQLDIEAEGKPGELYRCYLRANLPQLVTGDRIIWRADKSGKGVVVATTERDSELCRPDNHGQVKPVAANIDYIVLVIAALPIAHRGLIDRYLVAAEAVNIEPIILLNKTDLLDEDNRQRIESMVEDYAAIGYRTIRASTVENQGLEGIRSLLDQHTSVFVGQSGVGKSSLVNALLPGVDIRVGALSEQSGKGTHTTTAAKLFHIPGGGRLIDSPGIREFGLWHMDAQTIIEGFKEFRPFLGLCKFRDCQHMQEPKCALLKAVDEGEVSPQRLQSYRQILESIDDE